MMTKQHGPCGCPADDPVHNPHTLAEHTECYGWPPCGGCDSCICLQVSYYRRLERTTDAAQ